jgi:ribA/ribD-fused uncharacterized protein
MEPIDKFRGSYDFLSNFYPVDIEMPDGITYPTAEHAFQAYKTEDLAQRKHIASLSTPGKSKSAGRKVSLRDGWNSIRVDVMEEVVRRKFWNPDLAKKLLATGDVQLIEGNTWNDTFWGVCRGKGKNHLGNILMKIRNEKKQEDIAEPKAEEEPREQGDECFICGDQASGCQVFRGESIHSSSIMCKTENKMYPAEEVFNSEEDFKEFLSKR